MFKKLLANLPFNPSLIDQVSLYYGHLRQETILRRLGFLFMVAAILVQLLAVLYPAQESLAASPNDILDGINNKNDILHAWDSSTHSIRTIYSRFGITRNDIANISGQNPNSTLVSTQQDFWSIGRLPLSAFGISSNKWSERSINANGVSMYERPLRAWNIHGSSSYPAYHGKNRYGVDFWILKTSGDPTFLGSYLPQAPKPKLVAHNTLLTSNLVHRGDTVKFRLEYQNTAPGSLATNFRLEDKLNSNFELVSLQDLSSENGPLLEIKRSGQLGYTPTPYVSILTLRVKNSSPNHSLICNSATIYSNQSTDTSEKPCVTVIVPQISPASPMVPSPSSQSTLSSPTASNSPSGYCLANAVFLNGSKSNFVVQTEAYVVGDTKVTGYKYDIDANGSIDQQDKTNSTFDQQRFSNLKNGAHDILVYTELSNAAGAVAQSPACETQITINEQARVDLSKSVVNLTRRGDANNTTVQNGDILKFKLTTQNVTNTDYINYNARDYFGSVLQYANMVNTSQLAQQGLSLDSHNNLNWHISNLGANQKDVKTIEVKVKNIIPATNTPSRISPDYNCKITNDYGNEVTMNVNCPVVKSIEQAASSLPNTGPDSSLSAGVLIAIVSGYFFLRAKIFSSELAAVKKEYSASGEF